jgi:hypothetical protein
MWSTTKHLDDHELMLAVDAELTPRRQAALDAHAAECASCRRRRDELATALRRVSPLLQSESADATPASSYARIRLAAAMRKMAEEDRERWTSWRLPAAVRSGPHLVASVGLIVVLVVGAVLATRATQARSNRQIERAALPLSELTPGAVSTLTVGELCAGGRPSRLVPDATRRQVLSGYAMEHVSDRMYELDALVTPDLGGTTDAANLWPQRYYSPVWNARVKDELEELLPKLVCGGRLELSVAQRAIAADWVGAYKRFFQTDRPLHAHVTRPAEDEPELVLLPPVHLVAQAGSVLPIALRGR